MTTSRLHLRSAAILALLFSNGVAHAACEVRSGPARARLVELYTSEGCSSCPPADRWLAAFEASASMIPLALHVDYWDDLGWRDRFADPRFGRRQRSQVALGGASTVYTPQVFVDGRAWSHWSRGGDLPNAAGAVPSLQLSASKRADGTWQPELAVDATDRGNWQAYFALVEAASSSEVSAGENRGRTLRHRHVVRAWAGPVTQWPARATLQTPQDFAQRDAAIVAFVEDADSGRTGQALRLPLARCEAP